MIELGIAGGSAQHEFARRQAKRQDRIRTAHPRLGGLILALSDDPQSTTAWKSGAVGERKLGDKLSSSGDTIIALHDRRVPMRAGGPFDAAARDRLARHLASQLPAKPLK